MLPLAMLVTSLAPLPGDFVRAQSICACGDVDGDGIAEIALGLPRDDAHGEDAGRVFVLSGRDGSVLRELHGIGEVRGFGFALASGDFDGDGAPDLAIAAHRDGFAQAEPPRERRRSGGVFVHRLSTGELLRRIPPPSESALEREFASRIERVGDLDDDGADDLWVESRDASRVDAQHASPVCIVSGATGAELRRIHFSSDERRPRLVGDVDGDGVRDAVVIEGDRLVIASLAKRAAIDTASPLLVRSGVRAIEDAGDFDFDLCDDLVVLEPCAEHDGFERASVRSSSDGRTLVRICSTDLRRAADVEAQSWCRTLNACAVPDADRDGAPELAVALLAPSRSLKRAEWEMLAPSVEFPLGTFVRGFAVLVRGTDASIAWSTIATHYERVHSAGFESGFGDEMRAVGDVNLDGAADVAIGGAMAATSDPYENAYHGFRVQSARTGDWIYRVEAVPCGAPSVTFGPGAWPRERRR